MEQSQDLGQLALVGRRVLIAEDSPADATKYREWLAAAGATVVTVSSLTDARRALQDGEWDAVVLDRLLPDGDALEWLAGERRTSPHAPMTPCVLVSGYLDEKTYRATYEIGAVPLPKHYIVHPDVLLAAIGSALRSP